MSHHDNIKAHIVIEGFEAVVDVEDTLHKLAEHSQRLFELGSTGQVWVDGRSTLSLALACLLAEYIGHEDLEIDDFNIDVIELVDKEVSIDPTEPAERVQIYATGQYIGEFENFEKHLDSFE
jgi:hypothetical protein